MIREKGFVRGVVVPLLVFIAIGFILYNAEFSFNFKGKEVIKPLWEKVTDKAVQVVKVVL